MKNAKEKAISRTQRNTRPVKGWGSASYLNRRDPECWSIAPQRPRERIEGLSEQKSADSKAKISKSWSRLVPKLSAKVGIINI